MTCPLRGLKVRSMKIFIFGIDGNMGQRYACILRHLGHKPVGVDISPYPVSNDDLITCDGIIIATPTSTHLQILNEVLKYKKPVLCEKPFINDPSLIPDLKNFLDTAKSESAKISMVSQYDKLKIENWGSRTCYNYYKSGSDGIAWDCINIIWHATGKISLKNESPIWFCIINGRPLRIELMDLAYVQMIEDWLCLPYQPQYERIFKAHQKVVDYLDGKFD
jgi:hypothetical protein